MTRLYSAGTVVFDRSHEMGNVEGLTGQGNFNISVVPQAHGDIRLLDYRVPAEKRAIIRNIIVAGYSPDTFGLYSVTSPTQTGACFLEVNGATVAEFRPTDTGWFNVAGVASGSAATNLRGFLAPLSGLTFPEGTTIALRIAGFGLQGKYYGAWLQGYDPVTNEPSLLFERAIVRTADATLVLFTVGANGFVLSNYGAQVWIRDAAVVGRVSVFVNNRIILEATLQHQLDMSVSPVLKLPFDFGLELWPFDSLTITASANIYQAGDKLTAFVYGEEIEYPTLVPYFVDQLIEASVVEEETFEIDMSSEVVTVEVVE